MEMVHCMDLLWNSSPSSPKSLLCHVKLVLWSVITTKKRKRKRKHISKVKKQIKSINIFNQILVPLHPHGNKDFIENRKEMGKKKNSSYHIHNCVCEREWEHTFIIYQYSGSKNKTREAEGDSWSKEKSNEEHLEFLDKQT